MPVPITSDLAGYAQFWERWLVVLVVIQTAGFTVIATLLFLIWRKG